MRVAMLHESLRTPTTSIEDGDALVWLPSEEIWSLVSLPRGVQLGDTVAVRVVDGDMECWIEPRRGGLQA